MTSYTYDNLNRRTRATLPDPDGGGPLAAPYTDSAYDAAGRLVSQTDPLGNVTTYQYDNLGRQIQVMQPDPDGGGPLSAPVTSFSYDAAGQLLSETDPLSHVTTYAYDNLGRKTTMTGPDPDGGGPLTSAVTTYAYNALGLLTAETDPLSHTTQYAYDNLSRRTSLTDPLSGSTSYTYDAAGNVLTLKDSVNNTTTWTYDNLNRKTQESNQLSQSRTFVYDAASRLTKRTDRNGRIIEYGYDNLGRQTAETWKDGQTTVRTISFAFDAANQLASASDPAANYTYGYDNLGRTNSIFWLIAGLSPSLAVTNSFDAASHRTQAAFAIGGADLVNNYTFDNLGRMIQVQQAGQLGGNAVAPKRVDFAYDAASRTSTITRYANLAGTQLVATSSFTFDNASRLTGLSHAKGGTTLAGYTWQYDAAARVTQFVSTTDGTANYTYDNTDQVTAATYNYQTNEAYSYDANGNRTNTGYTTGSDNRMTKDGTFTYIYDAEGNRTARFVDTDQSGTLNAGDTQITEYAWDWRNRLTSVTERATYGGASTKLTEFAYDHENRLVKEVADPDGAGPQGSQSTYYGFDGSQIVFRFNGPAATNLADRYLWGPAVDQILADEQVTSLYNPGTVLWPLADNLGTVRDLAQYNPVPDTTTIANHRVYNAYGNLTSQTNPAVDHLFGFTGRMLDKSTGLQNNLNRWYDPLVGRWLSQDPSGFDGDDGNLYRYVGNRATESTDSHEVARQSHFSAFPSRRNVHQSRTGAPGEAASSVQKRYSVLILGSRMTIGDWGVFQEITRWKLDRPTLTNAEIEQVDKVSGKPLSEVGWIIQHIKIFYHVAAAFASFGTHQVKNEYDDRKREYWEAWPVYPGQTEPPPQLNLDRWALRREAGEKMRNTAGGVTIVGRSMFYANQKLPAGFKQFNEKTNAGVLYSTDDPADMTGLIPSGGLTVHIDEISWSPDVKEGQTVVRRVPDPPLVGVEGPI